ncbi:MAG: ankyrin repeat domain-containing protein [Puniceicoccales bacterium]|jgi:ankyrin repeat protein|nr:ankyrin repeat domain-containing protein [Puniceicoccales bacterium]
MRKASQSRKNNPASFPTCGEVFHFFIIDALELHKWQDAWREDDTNRTNLKNKEISDKLNDWKKEKIIPTQKDFEYFIDECFKEIKIKSLENENVWKNITIALKEGWKKILNSHCDFIKKNTVDTKTPDHRIWLSCSNIFTALVSFLYTKRLVRRVLQEKEIRNSPIIKMSLHDLLCLLLEKAHGKQERSLTMFCVTHYASVTQKNADILFDEFKLHPNPKSFFSFLKNLSKRKSLFKDRLDFLEFIINFAFARSLEQLQMKIKPLIPKDCLDEFYKMLLLFSNSLNWIEKELDKTEGVTKNYSFEDYIHYVQNTFEKYVELFQARKDEPDGVCPDEINSLKHGEKLTILNKYFSFIIPQKLNEYFKNVQELYDRTTQVLTKEPRTSKAEQNQIREDIKKIKQQEMELIWNPCLSGLLLLAEARISLFEKNISIDSIRKIYDAAVEKSLYRAAVFIKPILEESLGFTALLYSNGENGETQKEVNTWLKKRFTQWDLLDMGHEFDHRFFPQRVEKAKIKFISRLSDELLKERGIPVHHHYSQTILNYGSIEIEYAKKLLASPVNTRRKNELIPAEKTLRGESQPPVMEALDCALATKEEKYLNYAEKLIQDPDVDLNFITQSDETILTRAFECEAYELILRILERANPTTKNPILRETFLHSKKIDVSKFDKDTFSSLKKELDSYDSQQTTGKPFSSLINRGDQMFIANAVGLAIAHGQLSILKKLNDIVDDLTAPIVNGVTPLFYAVFLISMIEDPNGYVEKLFNESSTLPVHDCLEGLANDPSARDELSKMPEVLGKYLSGIYACLDFLISSDGANVDVNIPNDLFEEGDHTSLTFSVKCKREKIVLKLLKNEKTNINYPVSGGYTAIYFAIKNNDIKMVNILLEYAANCSLLIEKEKCHIYDLPMSEEIRKLIPRHENV